MDNYIKEIKEYVNNNPGLTETELIMYVYLDLGMRLKFDQDFFFGGSKKKSEIYYKASFFNELNKCFNNNTIICKSSANILEYVLKKLGVNIITEIEDNPLTRYKHVLNVIIPADGSESYKIDLQNDLTNIHFHSFTSCFGNSTYDDKVYVIPPAEQKRIHTKLGYISDNNPYLDDYVEQFKIYMPKDLKLSEKVDLVLKNIEPYPFLNVSYWERRWKHENTINAIFTDVSLDNKLHTVEFYQKNGDEIIYNNGYFMADRDGVTIYYYNIDNFCYDAYTVSEFAKKVLDENICYRQGIMGLQKEINIIKDQKVKKI